MRVYTEQRTGEGRAPALRAHLPMRTTRAICVMRSLIPWRGGRETRSAHASKPSLGG